MNGLKQKSAINVIWLLLEKSGLYIFKFVLGIILARLLTPADYGLIGMIMIFFSISNVFVEGGFGMAYVQKLKANDSDAATVFSINFIVGLVFYWILYFTAPMIANFYEKNELISLVRVMGLVVIINAVNFIQIARIMRELNFRIRAKVTIVSTILSGGIAIIAAIKGLGVWSLVLKFLLDRLFITLGFMLVSKWLPRFNFSLSRLKGLFSFGFWVLMTGLLHRAFDNIYFVLIGKYFSAGELGYYTKSKQFQNIASESIIGAFMGVAFPVYSKLQDQEDKLRNAMRRFLQYSSAVVTFILLNLLIVSKPFVILLLTDKWAPMIPYLQLLCFLGILLPLYHANLQSLLAKGKTKLRFKLEIVKNALRVVNIFLMIKLGVFYLILGEIVLQFIVVILYMIINHNLINYGIVKQFRDISKIFLGGFFATAISYLIVNNITINLWQHLFIGILITSSLYVSYQYFYNRFMFTEILSLKNTLTKKSS